MSQREKSRGFTLIELMVVIVILGIIGTMGFVFLMDSPDDARWDTTVNQMQQIHSAINQYRLNNGEYPDGLDTLQERYFPNGVPKDPWTKENFLYDPTESGYELTCLGKDQAEGGDAKPNKDIRFNEAGLIKD